MAGIPVLASNLETFEDYIDKYKFGLTVDPHDIRAIAQAIKTMISDEKQMKQWRENAQRASKILNWDNESHILLKIYEQTK